jgi:hypothetical protein
MGIRRLHVVRRTENWKRTKTRICTGVLLAKKINCSVLGTKQGVGGGMEETETCIFVCLFHKSTAIY